MDYVLYTLSIEGFFLLLAYKKSGNNAICVLTNIIQTATLEFRTESKKILIKLFPIKMFARPLVTTQDALLIL